MNREPTERANAEGHGILAEGLIVGARSPKVNPAHDGYALSPLAVLTVFRYEPEHAGRDREIFQVGAELIGADQATADTEIISLLIECLRRVELRSFKISLGHVGFFKGLLVRAGLSPEGQKRAEQAAAGKDLPWLGDILSQERVAKPFAAAILEAPELCFWASFGDLIIKTESSSTFLPKVSESSSAAEDGTII